MTTTDLASLLKILQKVEKSGLTVTINDGIKDSSCGLSAVIVTVDADTAECYHDLLKADEGCVWEICPSYVKRTGKPLALARG